MINSKRKGNKGEREFASLCRSEGYSVRRGQQYNGIEGEDVIGLPGCHVEVKRVERLNIEQAMCQSVRDNIVGKDMAGDINMVRFPIVAHRKNNCEWLVTMRFRDWINLYREWEAGRVE